jgi:hypothetical protein
LNLSVFKGILLIEPYEEGHMRFTRFNFLAALLLALMTVLPVSAQNPRSERSGDSTPSVLTLPAGTLVMVRTTQMLSSDQNRPGDEFTLVLDEPIVVQGWVVARRGQTVVGRVVDAERAGRGQGVSRLSVELTEIVLVDGQQTPVRTELVQVLGRGPRPNDQVATVGATTGVGAVIGAVAGGGEGAAIGAAIGAAAGVAGVLTARGRPTEIYPETALSFRLERPVTISTENSRQAFAPVDQRDYSARADRNPARYPAERVYPPPPPRVYYGPYDYDYDYYEYRPYGYSVYVGSSGPYYYRGGVRVYIRPGYRRHR